MSQDFYSLDPYVKFGCTSVLLGLSICAGVVYSTDGSSNVLCLPQQINETLTDLPTSKLIFPHLDSDTVEEFNFPDDFKIIANHFTNIWINLAPNQILKLNNESGYYFNIFKTIAEFNKDLADCPGRSEDKGPLKLTIHVTLNVTSSASENNTAIIRRIADLGEKINRIYRGTIEGVAIASLHTEAVSVEEWQLFRFILLSKELKLGLVGKASYLFDVTASGLKEYFRVFFGTFDSVTVQSDPCSQLAEAGELFSADIAGTALTTVFDQFDNLQARFSTKFDTIFVAFERDKCGSQANVEQFYHVIVVRHRFRNFHLVIDTNFGNLTRKSIRDVGIDKRSGVIINDTTSKLPEININASGTETTTAPKWLLFSGSALLLLVITAAFIFIYVWRKHRSNITEQFQIPQIDSELSCLAHGRPNSLKLDSTLEISRSSFKIEADRLLGSGAFGTITLGNIVKNGMTKWVAVKMARITDANQTTVVGSLVMEARILQLIGKHVNITEMVGVYTAEFSSGALYVFLELCHLGSLQNYLRGKAGDKSSKCHEPSEYLCLQEDDNTTTADLLIKWSAEIASGMGYISGKNIVHADLATRNVLLDKNKTAKICDFGLSRRMANYQNYIKGGSEPLPWKWMAPETLLRMEFSTKSDVWSYGVTLWEIFSEGKVPYPGLAWTFGFVEELEAGLRLPKPKNASQPVYDLMCSCWDLKPESRPDFSDVLTFIEKQFEALS